MFHTPPELISKLHDWPATVSFVEVVNSPANGDVGSSAISGAAAAKDKNAAENEKLKKKRLIFIISGKLDESVANVKFYCVFN